MTGKNAGEVLIGLINPVPGREDEFNDWYSTVHIPELLQLPGFVTAQRYEIADDAPAPYRYGTIYQIEGSAADARNALFNATLEGSSSYDAHNMLFGAFAPMGDPITP